MSSVVFELKKDDIDLTIVGFYEVSENARIDQIIYPSRYTNSRKLTVWYFHMLFFLLILSGTEHHQRTGFDDFNIVIAQDIRQFPIF